MPVVRVVPPVVPVSAVAPVSPVAPVWSVAPVSRVAPVWPVASSPVPVRSVPVRSVPVVPIVWSGVGAGTVLLSVASALMPGVTVLSPVVSTLVPGVSAGPVLVPGVSAGPAASVLVPGVPAGPGAAALVPGVPAVSSVVSRLVPGVRVLLPGWVRVSLGGRLLVSGVSLRVSGVRSVVVGGVRSSVGGGLGVVRSRSAGHRERRVAAVGVVGAQPVPVLTVVSGSGGGSSAFGGSGLVFFGAVGLLALFVLRVPWLSCRLAVVRELGTPAPFVLLLDRPG